MAPRQRKGTAFSRELSTAIVAADVTLTWLAKQLRDHGNPVSLPTLSYWRSGDRVPEGASSLSAVANIETLLGLESNALTGLIETPMRVGTLKPPRDAYEERVLETVAEVTAIVRAPSNESIRPLSMGITAFVDAHGHITHTRAHTLMQMVSETVSELAFLSVTDGESIIAAVPDLIDVVGGSVVRSYLHPNGFAAGTVIRLDEPVPQGSTTVLELTEITPPETSPPRTEFGMSAARRTQEMLLTAQFTAGAAPAWCEEFTRYENDDDEDFRELPIRGDRAHTFRHSFGPGALGIRWSSD